VLILVQLVSYLRKPKGATTAFAGVELDVKP
jgi:hypothetical protein